MKTKKSDISHLNGQKVKVYYHFRKKCWSVVHNGKVVVHLDSLLIKDVIFHVQQAGRERVIREGRKNVHAYAAGTLVAPTPANRPVCCDLKIWYNPYKYKLFQTEYHPVPGHGLTLVRDAWGAGMAFFDGKEVYRSEVP